MKPVYLPKGITVASVDQHAEETFRKPTNIISMKCIRGYVLFQIHNGRKNVVLFIFRMLQNNQLKSVPSAALKNLQSLQSL